jgi:integrase
MSKNDKSFELNTHEYHGGKLVLYQRHDHKNPRWQARIKIPQSTGYEIFSTKEKDLSNAKRIAEQKLFQLTAASATGQTLKKSIKIKPAITKYLDDYKTVAPSTKRYEDQKLVLETYFLPFFLQHEKKTQVGEINKSTFNNYLIWRASNYQRKKPTNSYLRKEVMGIRRFYNWCVDKDYVDELRKKIDLPKAEINRRPHFTEDEYLSLTRFMKKWENEAIIKLKDGTEKKMPWWRDRFLLRRYILILANTGMRTSEARFLRWGDISDDVRNEDGKDTTYIYMKVSGKTGGREITCMNTDTIEKSLNELAELQLTERGKDPKRNDYVFASSDGKPITSFKTALTKLLKNANLLTTLNGEKRTGYSFRHTYATFRLNNGVDLHDLAKNMGTSTQLLESTYYHAIARSRSKQLTQTRTERPYRADQEIKLRCLTFK